VVISGTGIWLLKKGGGMVILLAITVFVAVILLWGIGIYNLVVKQRENTKNGWSQIDVQLKRRPQS